MKTPKTGEFRSRLTFHNFEIGQNFEIGAPPGKSEHVDKSRTTNSNYKNYKHIHWTSSLVIISH